MQRRRVKGKQRPSRARARRVRRGLAALGIVAAACGGLIAVWLVFFQADEPAGPPRAVIVDQLSLTAPNAEFTRRATALLEQAGYIVDYVPGEKVDVDFYRKLPAYHYKFIVFRVHSDTLQAMWQGKQIDDVVLFSSEVYDRNLYVRDQAANRLVVANYTYDPQSYFGIAPDFFDELGDFHSTTIVMMGCQGIQSEHAAQAFIDKGAKTYISWDQTVSANHTDDATEHLLQHMLVEKQSSTNAVAQTMAEVGPDPTYGSKLVAFPHGS